MNNSIENFKNTITASTSPYHTSYEAARQLKENGFTELSWDQSWSLKSGGKYFVCPYTTSLFAFSIGDIPSDNVTIKLASAHIDNPGLRIKYNPLVNSKDAKRLNIEVYGGAIYNTWFDRPLSIAGQVILKNDTSYQPRLKLVDFSRPVLELPNLAIHLNRNVNDGIALNAQTDLLPICSTDSEASENYFLQMLAKELNESPDDILFYDLCVYNCDSPVCTGFEKDMLLAPRIDNLSSVQACLSGIIKCDNYDGINIIALYDHEEIGSRSKNGAQSNILSYILERICISMNIKRETFIKSLNNSYYLSLDVAHAINPNHPEKSDITSAMPLNKGFAIKCSSKQSYCTDSKMAGIIMQIAKKNNIPCQPNYMRSDCVGGSTVGPIISSEFPVNCADIGIPIYAMHSANETAGVYDQYYLEQFMKIYFDSCDEWK